MEALKAEQLAEVSNGWNLRKWWQKDSYFHHVTVLKDILANRLNVMAGLWAEQSTHWLNQGHYQATVEKMSRPNGSPIFYYQHFEDELLLPLQYTMNSVLQIGKTPDTG